MHHRKWLTSNLSVNGGVNNCATSKFPFRWWLSCKPWVLGRFCQCHGCLNCLLWIEPALAHFCRDDCGASAFAWERVMELRSERVSQPTNPFVFLSSPQAVQPHTEKACCSQGTWQRAELPVHRCQNTGGLVCVHLGRGGGAQLKDVSMAAGLRRWAVACAPSQPRRWWDLLLWVVTTCWGPLSLPQGLCYFTKTN